MAVLGRILVNSSQRIDLPDLLSIDAYSAGDWQYFLQTLVGTTTPYIIRGFDVINPTGAITQSGLSIRVADSAVYYPQSSAGPFFYGLPEGNTSSTPLVPSLVANATNYIYLTLTTVNTAEDSRAFWDPDANGGAGAEYSAPINTEEAIAAYINVSTGSFPQGTVPIAIVVCSSSGGGDTPKIDSITDARNMMFRLGSGGISPNPFNSFSWPSLPSSGAARNEPPVTITSDNMNNAFQGGDKNITSLKQWMDAIMSRIKELGGTQYWYNDSSTMSMMSMFVDSLATAVKSKGTWTHSQATAGLLTWSEDLVIKSTQDPRNYIIRGLSYGGGSGTANLPDDSVLYVPMNRNYQFNGANQGVQWTASPAGGANVVYATGGTLGLFANLNVGDYVKKSTDSNDKYLRVEQFYASTSGSGATASPALAASIKLSGPYLGTTEIAAGVADQGVYTTASVALRGSSALTTAGGNYHWLAIRSDIIEGVAGIAPNTTSGTIVSAANNEVTVSTVAPHGLSDGDYITIMAPAAYVSGGVGTTVAIDLIDANKFSYQSSITSTGSLTAYSAVVTTAIKYNSTGNLQLESANNNFVSGDTVVIAGTTNYNASYSKINPRSGSAFNIPLQSNPGPETPGSSATATVARVVVRTADGNSAIAQGEVINVSDIFANNAMTFLGMTSVAQTVPPYSLPSGYNTLYGLANYNSSATDSVTSRLSRLTAMMGDKAQDKTIQRLPVGLTSVKNTTNASAQEITFNSGATLVLSQPGSISVGSPCNATVTLPSSSPGISLLGNQSAYVQIDRNNSSTPSIVVANTASVPVDENVFIIASRITGSDVFLWDGSRYTVGTTTPFDLQIDRNIRLEDGGILSYSVSGGIGTLTFTQNLNLVLNANTSGTPITISLGSSSKTFTANGDMWYVVVDRTSSTVVSSSVVTAAAGLPTVQANQQVFLIAKRSDSADSNLVSYGMASRLYFYGGFSMVQGQTSPMGNDKTFISPVNFVPTNVAASGTNYDLAAQATPFIRLTTLSTNLRRIAAGSSGQFMIIKNAAASSITILNAASSGTGSQIITGTGVDLSLAAGASISLIYDATSSTWNIVGGTGAGGGSTTPYNDDLISTLFKAKITDTFTEPATATASTIDASAGATTATFLPSKQMYQLQYDAGHTIVAGSTTTQITVSGISYSVAVGDMVIIGTGTANAVARRISGIISTNVFTVDAFPAGVVTAGAQVTVSQCVITKNLYTSAFDGDSISTTFGGVSFQEVLIDYEDASGTTNNIFDIATAPVIGWSATNDGSTWTAVGVRPTLQSSTASSSFFAAAAAGLNIRFFANKTSGDSTTTPVNLITYRAYMLKDSTSAYGSQNSAIGFTDSPTTGSASVNCTVTTVGGKTRITLGFQYAVGVSSGSPYGALDVYLNGQMIPRYINSTITPDANYTEVNANTIDLDQNYSTFNLSVEVVQRVTVTDTSTQNTTNISILQAANMPFNHIINGNFDFWQRGTTSLVNTSAAISPSVYVADMWSYTADGTTNKNFQIDRTGITGTPAYALGVGSVFASNTGLKVTAVSANSFGASDRTIPLEYKMEANDFEYLAAKTVTLGFWFYSTVTGTYSVALRTSGSRSYVTTFTCNSASTWEYKTITMVTDNSAIPTGNFLAMRLSIGGLAGSTYTTSVLNTWQAGDYTTASTATNYMGTAGAYFYISQVSLVLGAYGMPSTNFVRNGKTIAAELLSCQRYYEKTFDVQVTPVQNSADLTGSLSFVAPIANQTYYAQWRFKADKRAIPAITTYNPSAANANWTGTPTAGQAQIGSSGVIISASGTLAAGTSYQIHATADASL